MFSYYYLSDPDSARSKLIMIGNVIMIMLLRIFILIFHNDNDYVAGILDLP